MEEERAGGSSGEPELTDWVEVYGLLCTTLGKTPEEVGRMRITEAARLFEYWGRSPPVHVMVAAYFGIESHGSSVQGKVTDEGLVAMLGGQLTP